MKTNGATIRIEHDRTSSTRELHSDEEAFHDPITGSTGTNVLKIAFDDFSNPEILPPDWVAEGEMERYKVRLKGHHCALTSVRFEVTNKQLISFSQFADDCAPHFTREHLQPKAAAS